MGGKTGNGDNINPNRVEGKNANRPFVKYETVERGLRNLKGNQAIHIKGGHVIY